MIDQCLSRESHRVDGCLSHVLLFPPRAGVTELPGRKKRYRVQLSVNGRQKYFGSFGDPFTAALTYDRLGGSGLCPWPTLDSAL